VPVNTAYDLPPFRQLPPPPSAPTITVSTVAGTDVTIQPAWYRLTGALVRWIRFHFSLVTRIENPALIGRVWTPAEDAPIFISSLAEWEPRKSEQRPAVLVDRLDQDKDMAHRGIGDQLQGGQPGRFAHFMNGRHVVHCLGGAEGEAELLAHEVWRDLVRFAPVLREKLCLLRLIPVRVGKRVQLSNEYKLIYTVPVELSYAYEECWRVQALDEPEITAIKSVLATL
jgi:hypothetical protein